MFKLVQKEHIILPAHAEQLGVLRDFVKQLGKKYGYSRKLVNAFKLAVDEAASNIIEHAYDNLEGYITVQALVKSRSLTIKLIDQGLYFHPDWSEPADIRESVAEDDDPDLGLFMIRKLMDRVEYRKTNTGNELTLTKTDDRPRRLPSVEKLSSLAGQAKVRHLFQAVLLLTTVNCLVFGSFYLRVEKKLESAFLQAGKKLTKQVARQVNSLDASIAEVTESEPYLNAVLVPIYEDATDRIDRLFLTDTTGAIIWSTDRSEIGRVHKSPEAGKVEPNIFTLTTRNLVQVYALARPVVRTNNERVAVVHIFLKRSYLVNDSYHARIRYFRYGLISLGIGYIFLAILTYFVLQPLRKLSSWVKAAEKGENLGDYEIDASSNIGEIALAVKEISQKFNDSQANLARQDQAIKQMDAAQDIQNSLLPNRIPATTTLDIEAFYQAAENISGDYYDFVHIDDHTLGIAIADVSGKGVAGSLMMSIIRTAIRTEACSANAKNAAEVLTRVNEFVLGDIREGLFVTVLYAIIDLRTLVVNFASAGHTPLILHRPETAQTFYLNPAGFPVGLRLPSDDLFARSIESATVQMQHGDTLLFYTDGVTEAMSPNRKLFGEEKLIQTIRKYQHLSLPKFQEKLRNCVYSFTEESALHDDVTFVLVRPKPGPETVSIEPDERITVTSQFMSIEESTRVLDIVAKSPQIEVDEITDVLSTDKYKRTVVSPDLVARFLRRRGLHIPRARRDYQRAYQHRARNLGPPGAPQLTLGGRINTRKRVPIPFPPDDVKPEPTTQTPVTEPGSERRPQKQREQSVNDEAIVPAASKNRAGPVLEADSEQIADAETQNDATRDSGPSPEPLSSAPRSDARPEPENSPQQGAMTETEIPLNLEDILAAAQNTHPPKDSDTDSGKPVKGEEATGPKAETNSLEATAAEPDQEAQPEASKAIPSTSKNVEPVAEQQPALLDSAQDPVAVTRDPAEPKKPADAEPVSANAESIAGENDDRPGTSPADPQTVSDTKTTSAEQRGSGSSAETVPPTTESMATPEGSDSTVAEVQSPQISDAETVGITSPDSPREVDSEPADPETDAVAIEPSEPDNDGPVISPPTEQLRPQEDVQPDAPVEIQANSADQDTSDHETVAETQEENPDIVPATSAIEVASASAEAGPPAAGDPEPRSHEPDDLDSADDILAGTSNGSPTMSPEVEAEFVLGEFIDELIGARPLPPVQTTEQLDDSEEDNRNAVEVQEDDVPEPEKNEIAEDIEDPAFSLSTDISDSLVDQIFDQYVVEQHDEAPTRAADAEQRKAALVASVDETRKEASEEQDEEGAQLAGQEADLATGTETCTDSDPAPAFPNLERDDFIQSPATSDLKMEGPVLLRTPDKISDAADEDSGPSNMNPEAVQESDGALAEEEGRGLKSDLPPLEDEVDGTLSETDSEKTTTGVDEVSTELAPQSGDETGLAQGPEGSTPDDAERTQPPSTDEGVAEDEPGPFIAELPADDDEPQVVSGDLLPQTPPSEIDKLDTEPSFPIQAFEQPLYSSTLSELLPVDELESEFDGGSAPEFDSGPTTAEPPAEKPASHSESQETPTTGPQEQAVDDEVLAGVESYREGRYKDAVVTFATILRARPEFKDGYAMLGNALYKSGKVSQALTCYQHLTRYHTADVSVHENMALIHYKLGDRENAIREWENVLKMNPARPDIEHRLSSLRARPQDTLQPAQAQGDAMPARQSETTATESMTEKSASATLEQGIRRYRNKDYHGAIEAFAAIVTQFPQKKEGYQCLGNAYFRREMLTEAADVYERLLQIDEHDSIVLENLALIRLKQQLYHEAIKSWRKLLDHHPHREDVRSKIERVSQLVNLD